MKFSFKMVLHGHGSKRSGSRGSGRAIDIPLETMKKGTMIDPQERLFLDAAEKGDRPTMIRCLHGPHPVNVNCTDMLGRSAIQIAADNENTEIVELLLKQDGVKIGDALLYAIREGVYRIVEMLIEHPSITREMLGYDWSKTRHMDDESYDYSPDISPVILAAHCNQFEILQLLLLHGASIERPHQLSCSCKRCQAQVHADSLRHSLLRINTYRALASPAWISLTSPDPVLSAFMLSWELDKLALRENEFKDSYLQLAHQCRKYACDLLDQCRSSEEVIAVLNKMTDSEEEEDEDEESDKLTLSRLKLALKYEQKQFVAHPHCQQLLTSIWYEGLPGWRKRNGFTKFLICIGLILLLPFMAVYYWIFPRSKIGQLLRSPFMKFLYHSASFGVFLFLLVCASTDLSTTPKRERFRGLPPSELEWMIVLWVTGFIWAECKQLWEEGLKAYVCQWWNWLDFIMLSLYLATFSLRCVAYLQIESGNYGPKEMDRRDWPLNEPTLISESLFAIANVFSFARIIYLFQANQHLGPLQISLGCMLIDIAKFLFIFFLVLTSFACGINQLYWYYNPSNKEVEDVFFTLPGAYITLFWSLFSLTPPKAVEIVDAQGFTVATGELLFMLYHGMTIVVLLNMLIAMMSSSFQDIENHADMEWKFSRSKLWMGYFDEGSTLPTPFNLFISPKSIYYFLRGIKNCFCTCCQTSRNSSRQRKTSEGTIRAYADCSAKIAWKWVRHGPVSSAIFMQRAMSVASGYPYEVEDRPTYNGDVRGILPPKPDALQYQEVMRRLVSRYIHQTKKQLRQDGVNEDDLLEIKQDISSLRYELREDRKRECARTTTHMDSLRQDIVHSLRGTSPNSSPRLHNLQKVNSNNSISNFGTSYQNLNNNNSSYGNMGYTSMLSQQDLEYLKWELMSGLRSEVREAVQSCLQNPVPPPPHPPPSVVSGIAGDLYHTHLYTQL